MQVYQCPRCKHELGPVEVLKHTEIKVCDGCGDEYLLEEMRRMPQGVRIDCPPAMMGGIARAGGK